MDPQAELMLRKADEDRDSLKFDLTDGIFGFHAQQAFEKLFKALIAAHEVRYDRTHNLELLLNQLQALNEWPLPTSYPILTLQPYAVLLRYDDAVILDAQERESIRNSIDAVAAFVAERFRVMDSQS
jgi:HEPN domain-containing protein